jgi:hypothetical protein
VGHSRTPSTMFKMFKMFKISDPGGILCKLDKLNNARTCLRRPRRRSIAISRMNVASVFAKFFRYRAPTACPPNRWVSACGGIEQFARGWAAKAMSLGWTFEELFARAAPFANASLQGAAWFVGDLTVTAVTADAITLRTEGGATQRIYRKPNGRGC